MSRPKAPRRRRRRPNSQLLRSHPAIDPEETRDPATQEDPEAFSFIPHSARATGDESRSLLVSHDSIVVGSSRLAADRIDRLEPALRTPLLGEFLVGTAVSVGRRAV